MTASNPRDWGEFSALITLLILGSNITISVAKLKFKLPQGPELKREKYTRLYEMLDEFMGHYQSRLLHIERVILCDSFDIKIVRQIRIT